MVADQVMAVQAIPAVVVVVEAILIQIKVEVELLGKVTTLQLVSVRTTHMVEEEVVVVEPLGQTLTEELENLVGGGSILLAEAEVSPAVQAEQVVAETVVPAQIPVQRRQTGVQAAAVEET